MQISRNFLITLKDSLRANSSLDNSKVQYYSALINPQYSIIASDAPTIEEVYANIIAGLKEIKEMKLLLSPAGWQLYLNTPLF